MVKIKRDWIYEAKWAYFGFASILILVYIMSYLSQNEIYQYAIATSFRSLYQVSNVLIIIFPVYAFARIAPKMGKVTDSPVLTAHLPFSNKQLWFMSIKKWLIAWPVYFVISTALCMQLQYRVVPEQLNLLLLDIVGSAIAIIFIIGGIGIQFIASLIYGLAKQIPWYKIVPSIILIDLIFVLSAVGIALLLKLDGDNFQVAFTYLAIVFVTFMMLNLVAFIKSFKYIERIYQ